MAKKSSALVRAFRKVGRAMASKDERAFDNALDDLEEHLEEQAEDEEQPEIEVHNHMPDNAMYDTARGQLPEKDPPGFDRHARDEEEAPPWAKKIQEDMKRMNDSVEGLKKWAEEEGREPEHSEDRRDRRHDDRRDRRHDDNENCLEDNEAENLEMDRRGRDDEEEMGEREPEWKEGHSEDRRHDDRRHDDRHRNNDRRDEANKEILGELEFEAPPGTGDRARRATDSRYLEEAFQDATSRAEVLAPGITLPTFDSKARPGNTLRQIHRLRQTALDLAYNQPATRGVIDATMGGRTMDSKRMSIGVTRVLFNSASSAVGTRNQQRTTDRSTSFENHSVGGGVQSIADLNKVNQAYYANAGRR